MPQGARRHTQYRSPRFGKRGSPKARAEWARSVYYWWWQYLRRSARYVETCAKEGAVGLRDLYADFGDVREDDFKTWWSKGNRGALLFGEPLLENSVRVITQPSELILNSDTLVVSFPLDVPKRYLQKRFRLLLAKYHLGKRGRQMAKRSRARFQVRGQPNIPALEQGLMVYDLRLSRPELKLWEIGQELRLLPKPASRNCESLKEQADRHNVLAATVSRYLRRAKASIAATERGEFPY